MKKLVVVLVFLAAASVMTWVVWFRPVKEAPEEAEPEADVPVQKAKIARATLRNYVSAYGPVEPDPKSSAKIAPSIAGIVATVKCVEGQHVERGAPLFQLDSRAANVTASFAEKLLDRQKKLSQIEGTSQKALQEAEQQLATARAQLDLLQVQSPLAGVVTRVNVKAGEAADLTTVLAEVVDLEHLVVSANVSSTELASLKSGQAAEVTSTDTTNVVSTTISFVSPQIDPKTGSAVVRVALPASAGFHPGQFARVRIVTEEHKDCLVVPAASVAKDPSGATFIALVEGEKANLKPVKVGLRDNDLVEVEGDGVEADADVVTEGAYGLIMTQQFSTKIK